MPNYDFKCEKCEYQFEEFLPMSKSQAPCKKPCPKCNEKSIHKVYSTAAQGVDMTKTAGSDFKQLTEGMKRGLPKRFHENLDKAASSSFGKMS
jgi:putative FmdB family regulatory protein